MAKLPWKKLIGPYVLLMCESIGNTSFFSYMGYMILSFGTVTDEEKVGYYAGYVASSFSLAQFVSSFFWGRMSDIFGRKPILMIGSIGSMISVLGVGTSWSLPMLIVSRTINGILNGNIGVVKTYVGEITDKSNQIEAFGWIGLTWGLGSILGPMIGGLLINPVENYPSVFGGSVLFEKFPYLLPNLVIACATATGTLFTLFTMKETLRTAIKMEVISNHSSSNNNQLSQHGKKTKKSGKKYNQLEEDDDVDVGDTDIKLNINDVDGDIKIKESSDKTIINNIRSSINGLNSSSNNNNIILIVDPNGNELEEINIDDDDNNSGNNNGSDESSLLSQPLSPDSLTSLESNNNNNNNNDNDEIPLVDKTNDNNDSIDNDDEVRDGKNTTITFGVKPLTDSSDEDELGEIDEGVTKHETNVFKNKLILSTTSLYAAIGFIFTMYDESFPLWALSPVSKGGLKFSSSQIGLCGMIGGISVIFMQLVIIKPVIRKIGLVHTFKYGLLLAILTFMVIPMMNYFSPYGVYDKLDENGSSSSSSSSSSSISTSSEYIEPPSSASVAGFWIATGIILFVRNVAGQFVFTPVMTLINNSATSRAKGAANGLGQSAVALTRAIAPTIASISLAWSLSSGHPFPINHFFVFVLMSLLSVGPVLYTHFKIPLSLNYPIEEGQEIGEDQFVAIHE